LQAVADCQRQSAYAAATASASPYGSQAASGEFGAHAAHAAQVDAVVRAQARGVAQAAERVARLHARVGALRQRSREDAAQRQVADPFKQVGKKAVGALSSKVT
jgi:hypothetical protein